MAKLVLDIEPKLINKLKDAAEKRNLSISELAEGLFRKETEDEVSKAYVKSDSFPDWIKRLTLSKTPTPDFDAKKEYGDYLMRKHSL